jgi:hypothetical protein
MIFPNNLNTPIDALKEIEQGKNQGIEFDIEIDKELALIIRAYEKEAHCFLIKSLN